MGAGVEPGGAPAEDLGVEEAGLEVKPVELNEIETLPERTRAVLMSTVNYSNGYRPDIARISRLTHEAGALLYLDDAHGFGVIGERSPDETTPYGIKGNSIVAYAGETYDNLVLVGGFSKSYSSLLAFIACPTEFKNLLKVAGRA